MASEIETVSLDTGNVRGQSDAISEQGSRVADEMQSVSAASEEQSASAAEIADSSESLAKLADDISREIAKYKF